MFEKVNPMHPDKVADRIAGAFVDMAYQFEENPRIAVELYCAIGDKCVGGTPYNEIVRTAREYIESVGGFERFAEWGLV